MKVVSKKEAANYLLKFHKVAILMWMSQRIENSKCQVIIANYSGIPGYAIDYAIGIYTKAGTLVERFNVKG